MGNSTLYFFKFLSIISRAELAVKTTKRLLMDKVNYNGDLDNEKMVWALLIQRNTPDPGCNLSPAKVLFGYPLRDTLPLIHKDVDTFHNNQFANHSREAWSLKEQLLKTQYVKSLENLADHSHPLPPLTIGYNIFIQNQTGQFPIHWDRSETVVNVKGHDQYVVKVAGTGRLTLHKRRFLKIFKPHLLFGSEAAQSHHSS